MGASIGCRALRLPSASTVAHDDEAAKLGAGRPKEADDG